MAKASKEILFLLAAAAGTATSRQHPENSLQPESHEPNPADVLGPPPEDSVELIPQKGYYLQATSRAPRLSLAEQVQLLQTLERNNPLPLVPPSDNSATASASKKQSK